MGSNKELLIVHREMHPVSLDHTVNVMLTPQFYTMKQEELPVKYLYQAKKIAPSLFDGLLDEEGAYAYFVFREDDHWVFIAYEPEKIRDFLLTKGIAPEHLSKIFFAQQSRDMFKDPVVLGEKEVLMNIDGSVALVPTGILSEDHETAVFDERFTPRSGVSLSGGSTLINKKETILLATVFLIFAAVFFVEGRQYTKGLQMQEKKMQDLLSSYPSLQSKIQRDSVALKYRTIDTKERHKREIIKTLGTMIFKGVRLNTFEMNEKKFKVIFSCENSKIVKKVETLAKKAHFSVKSGKNSNIVVIEGEV